MGLPGTQALPLLHHSMANLAAPPPASGESPPYPMKNLHGGVDLADADDILKLTRWTDEERSENERRAAMAVADHLGEDCLDVLQMLGLAPYKSAQRERNKTPIKHGERAGYTNRGCGKPGTPPCPASPTCSDANNEYFRRRRANLRSAA